MEDYILPEIEIHDLIACTDIKDVSAEPAASVLMSSPSLHAYFMLCNLVYFLVALRLLKRGHKIKLPEFDAIKASHGKQLHCDF